MYPLQSNQCGGPPEPTQNHTQYELIFSEITFFNNNKITKNLKQTNELSIEGCD